MIDKVNLIKEKEPLTFSINKFGENLAQLDGPTWDFDYLIKSIEDKPVEKPIITETIVVNPDSKTMDIGSNIDTDIDIDIDTDIDIETDIDIDTEANN